MLHLSKRKKGNSYSTIFLLLLTSTLVTLGACSKQIDLTDQDITEFGYEVDCEYCEISYTDESKAMKTISHNQGKWSYKLSDKVTFELKLSIKTTPSGNQAIQAFILKKQERQQGLLEGLQQGSIQKSFDFVKNLIIDFGFSDEQAAKAAEVSVEFVKKVRLALKNK